MQAHILIVRVQAHIRVVEFSKQLFKSGVIPMEAGDTAMLQSNAADFEDSDGDCEFEDCFSVEE